MHRLNLSIFHASLCERNTPLGSHLHFAWLHDFCLGDVHFALLCRLWTFVFCTSTTHWIDQQYLYFHFHLFKGKQLTIMMQNHNICDIANKQHKFIWCTYIHKSCFHVRKVHFTRANKIVYNKASSMECDLLIIVC